MTEDIQPLSVRTWRSLVMALGTMTLIGYGAMQFAGWVRERDEVLDTTQQIRAEAAAAAPATKPLPRAKDVDPMLVAYMYPTAKYGPPRKSTFGKNTAWLLTGYTPRRAELRVCATAVVRRLGGRDRSGTEGDAEGALGADRPALLGACGQRALGLLPRPDRAGREGVRAGQAAHGARRGHPGFPRQHGLALRDVLLPRRARTWMP